ncbi:putative pantothenate transporter [Talaromyces proteolyticus]|uniref:Pantothenate transporter n=1 Tax=Talaromyces proteolyticus TaxID=1131652 RepID=A0AAD4Q3U3_9EURO|nr:putative pantothenate transporter [Talaromyces proteolyticus]KAH8705429.1 putative pantothenate transporter [Talaromyces proteolyticus]
MAMDQEANTSHEKDATAIQELETVKASGLAAHEYVSLTPEEAKFERCLVRKVDLLALPMISLMYFLASLDRADVSNAAVAGMSEQLTITSQQLSNCVAFFFIGYIVFQVPGLLFIRQIQPQNQLGLAMIVWGTMTTILCKAIDWQYIAVVRVFIGGAEAFLQAGPLYLTFWYKREELASRGSIIMAMMAIAGFMNGLIAYGIEKNMGDVHGWGSWRWIFLIEGVLTVGMAFVVRVILPPVPEKIRWFFSEKEKEIAIRRSRQAFNVPYSRLSANHLLLVLKDPKVWFYTFAYCMMNISLTAFSSFLPLIIKSFGYDSLKTQLFTVPVFICAGVSTLFIGFTSDRMKRRGILVILCFATAAVGWIILILSKSTELSYAGTFLVGAGTYPTVVLIQSWQNSNVIGYTKRAGALALLMVFGQSFALMTAEIFNDPPHYYQGKGLSFAGMALTALLTPIFMLYLKRENDKKDQLASSMEAQQQRLKSLEELCDAHPDFRYWI